MKTKSAKPKQQGRLPKTDTTIESHVEVQHPGAIPENFAFSDAGDERKETKIVP